MLGDPDPQTSQDTGPDQPLAGNAMASQIGNHKTKLEEIRKKLHPELVRGVVKKTVEKSFIPDIVSIFNYIEEVERTRALFTYIRDPDVLYEKLNEIILVMNNALDAWDASHDPDNSMRDKLDAKAYYEEKLSACYGLLGKALEEFKPVKQAQEDTTTRGNNEPMRKTS